MKKRCEQYVGRVVLFHQRSYDKELIGVITGFSPWAIGSFDADNIIHVSGPISNNLKVVNIFVPYLNKTFQEWSERLLYRQSMLSPIKVLS